MSQVFLHRLNIIPGLNCHNRICMSEVMKPSRRRSDFFHKLFEATIDYTVREESPNFIGKYKVLFCPTLSRFEPLSVLFQFLKPEQFHHRGRKRQSSGFVVLGLGEVKLAVLVLLPAKLLLYRQRSIIQVQALPGKPQNLPLPNPCKKCDFIQVFIRVSMDCFQELGNLVIVQGLNVLFLYTGKLAIIKERQKALNGLSEQWGNAVHWWDAGMHPSFLFIDEYVALRSLLPKKADKAAPDYSLAEFDDLIKRIVTMGASAGCYVIIRAED